MWKHNKSWVGFCVETLAQTTHRESEFVYVWPCGGQVTLSTGNPASPPPHSYDEIQCVVPKMMHE